MSYLENPKTYTGTDLETIFFRPMLSGPSAEQLGIRILYNMPVPTTIQLWDAKRDILQKYTAAGWNGGTASRKYQKTIRLSRVKAELGFSAADYFSMVYELITGRPDVNMDDLSGTELEKAETELFRRSIAEGIRVTMWIGDTTGTKGYNTFDGFLKPILAGISEETVYSTTYTAQDLTAPAKIIDISMPTASSRSKTSRPKGSWPTSSPRTSTTFTNATWTASAPKQPTASASRGGTSSPTTASRWWISG